jgi:hypothetical protein
VKLLEVRVFRGVIKNTLDGSQLQENNPTFCILPDILRAFFILFDLAIFAARESLGNLLSILLETIQKAR